MPDLILKQRGETPGPQLRLVEGPSSTVAMPGSGDPDVRIAFADGSRVSRRFLSAQSILLRHLEVLRAAVDEYDERDADPGEFVELFWLITTLIDDTETLAASQLSSRGAVYRWKRGESVPKKDRRKKCLQAALFAVEAEMKSEPKPPRYVGAGQRD